ncbi:AAA family ATPase [Streptomyces griseorubiginosus]|uniref:AAA family ATPase n=1 Tax=Streptomyces griseorubiginosus TaxID=67304 RepID=UPI001AD79E4A|nr:AAA family ATPase [Streptomyces griseorubiginosus]MBO4255287.1 AAA family ATPase [Streptomyces griseorubiginosus]
MRGVVVVTGVMASGKSTVSQALAERLPRAAHVRGDTFRRMIVSGREDYAPDAGAEAESQLRLRHRLSANTADAYAEAGFTAVVQDVVLGERLTAYVDLFRTRPLYVVVLAPSPEAVAAREAGRAKTGYGTWTVAELDGVLRGATPRLGLWLDTTGLSVGETVEAIIAGRERARVR